MKRSRRAWLILIVLLAFGGGLAYWQFWQRPVAGAELAPTPTLDAFAPLAQVALTRTVEAGETATLAATAPAEATPQPTATPRPTVCGGPPQMLVLAVGTDYRGNDYLYGLADVIRLVRIDFTGPKIVVLSVPRDLWVYLPGVSARYGEPEVPYYGKINQAYFFGTPGMGFYQGDAAGAGYLSETMYVNWGIYPDRYVVVSMRVLEELIDAVGGIDITLTEPVNGNFKVNGKSQNLGYYPAGTHHFDGETAIKFARIRFGYSDLKRIDNQTLVLQALFKKIKSKEVWPRVPQLVASFLGGKVLTDFSPQEVSTFLCLAGKVDFGTIEFITLPKSLYDGVSIYSPTQRDYVFAFMPRDLDALVAQMQAFAQGEWP